MQNKSAIIIIFSCVLFFGSCVSKKKLTEANTSLAAHKELLARCEDRSADLEKQLLDAKAANGVTTSSLKKSGEEVASLNSKLKGLEDQVVLLKANNTSMLDQLNTLSVITKDGAESIKMSLNAISQQSQYIKDLTQSMQYKDSVNLALALNLKKTLSDFNDSDVNIEVKKGVVYISLSDKMLFKSGSAKLNSGADAVLQKIAGILNDQSNLEILVEGHTDNVPMSTECIDDNWDLSTKRATSVVRSLQKKYNVAPERMTAGGRSEYLPKASNESTAGKAENRRTEIIILPSIEQFFKLNEAPKPAGK